MSYYSEASLVMIPSGVKDGKVYSAKPVDGSGDFTFSRGSDIEATRVASNGYIEKAKVNLLLQSNSYTTTWTATNATLTSGQSGYDGTSDAWKIEAATTGITRIYQSSSIAANTLVTISLYAKVGNVDFIKFNLSTSGTNSIATFDLTDGTAYASNAIDESWESVGGGWVRISATFLNSDVIHEPRIEVRSNYNNSSCDAGSFVYIQDAQLNYGLVAQDYVETTTTSVVSGITNDMPRLDYSGGASCPSLLLEPSRSNAVTQSEYLNGLPDVSNVVVTTNATTSPEGVVNASKVVASAANTFHWVGINTSSGVSNGVIYTASVFAKAAEYEHLYIVLRADSGAKRYGVKFDLTNGTFVDDITFGSPTQTSYAIEGYPNGWYRCSVSTYHTSGNIVALFGPSLGGNVTDINNQFLGDGTSGIYMYGTQAEGGSYMTSLIPTYGTSATRTAESCSKTGISSLIGTTEGVVFLDITTPSAIEVDMNLSIGDGSVSNYSRIEIRRDLSLNIRYRIGGTNEITINDGSYTAGDRLKIAFAYKSGDSVLYMNGTQIRTSSATITANSFDQLKYSFPNGTVAIEGRVNQTLLFTTRLSNSDLATLTTL